MRKGIDQLEVYLIRLDARTLMNSDGGGDVKNRMKLDWWARNSCFVTSHNLQGPEKITNSLKKKNLD